MQKSAVKNIIIIVCLLLIAVAAFARSSYLNESGEFLSDFLTKSGINVIDVNKIDTRTDDVIVQKALNKDEMERLAHYLESQDFKKITSDPVKFDADEGYLIEGMDPEGNRIFSLKSYGDEFIVGYTLPNNAPAVHFKLKIKDKDWLNHMECFLI